MSQRILSLRCRKCQAGSDAHLQKVIHEVARRHKRRPHLWLRPTHDLRHLPYRTSFHLRQDQRRSQGVREESQFGVKIGFGEGAEEVAPFGTGGLQAIFPKPVGTDSPMLTMPLP
jgi:hypothetical protein